MIHSGTNLALYRRGEPLPFSERASARLHAIVQGREGRLIFILILGVAALAALMLYRADRDAFLYFGDAVSHLTRARVFVDSRVPGIHNIGTVWLPLPHLILLPLSLVDSLFFTGIAGVLVGIPCLAGTGVLLYSLMRKLDVPAGIAALFTLLFTLNPNTVYMALTPMTEILLLFFVALSAFMLVKWMDEEKGRFLVLAALAAAGASLCRYEAWLCVPFVSVAALQGMRRSLFAGFYHRAFVEGSAAVAVWMGIGSWLAWNLIEYKDPLLFAHWTHTIASRTVPEAVTQHPAEVIRLLGSAIRSIYGPFILIAAAAAVLRHLQKRLEKRALVVLVFLSLPGVFALSAVTAGYAQVDEWRWNWRYMLTLGLFLSASAGIGAAWIFPLVRTRGAHMAIVIGAIAIPVIQMLMPSVGVSTYIDAKKGFVDDTQYSKEAGELLKHADISGSVALVAGYAQAQRIMISSGRALKEFTVINGPDDTTLYTPLWPDEQYVVIEKNTKPESEGLVAYWLGRRSTLLARYAVVRDDEYFLILRLNPARSSYREQDRARR